MFGIERTGEGASFRLLGELDMATVEEFTEALRDDLGMGGEVTLHLSELSFVDSSGLRAVIQCAMELEGRGRLVLAEPTPQVRRLFDLAGIRRLPAVEIRPDPDAG
ncbi:MAG: STAS domain-containing protein [Actinobacteria bacterium]|nr:STAS domain-containing protein [Actinomycetota bacterium]